LGGRQGAQGPWWGERSQLERRNPGALARSEKKRVKIGLPASQGLTVLGGEKRKTKKGGLEELKEANRGEKKGGKREP